MPRVIRSPAKGAIVQPALHAHQAAAGASTAARPAASSASASASGAASSDFLYCFQLQPLCPLSYSAAVDWVLRQPAGVLSAPPSAAEWIRSQRRSQAAATAATKLSDSDAHAEVAHLDELGDADSSQLSLEPSELAAFDLAHGGSPAAGAHAGGSEHSDAIAAAAGAPGLPSVSVSVHTGTTQAKAAQQAAKANGGGSAQLSLESFVGQSRGLTASGTPAASPSRSHGAHSNATPVDGRRDQRADGSAGAGAAARSALPAAVSKRKQTKDVFSFPSQSSASRSDSQLSSQSTQPDAAPQIAAAAAAVVVSSCTTVPPSFTFPSRRPDAHEVIVIDADEPPSQVHLAPTPTPSPPPSVRIPASTPPSSASMPAGASANPPLFIPPPLDPSTRSLNPSAPYAIDPHIVLPSMAQLHTQHDSKDTAVHTIQSLQRDADDSEMKHMDVRRDGINAYARAQPAAHGGEQAPMTMSSDEHEHEHEREHEHEDEDELEHDSHSDPIVASQPHRPVSQSQGLGGTPPLAQREVGYERLRAPPAAQSTIVTSSSKCDESVAALPVAASLGYAANIASLMLIHVISPQIDDSPSQASASPAPQASPSHPPPSVEQPHSRGASFASSIMIDTPPQAHNIASSSHGHAPASGTPLQLQLTATPQLSVPAMAAVALTAVSAVYSSASFSSPSGTAPSAASASVHASSMQLRLEASPAASPATAIRPASPTTSSLPPSPSLSPALSPPLSPALSEALHADTNASYADHEHGSEPAMASMSLELSFDDDQDMMQEDEAAPADGVPAEAAVPVPQQADHEMQDVEHAAERAAEHAAGHAAPVLPPLAVDPTAVERVAESAHSPAALHHGTIPYSATGEVETSQPRALAATPRKPSIVSLPTADSAAATQVLKLSVSPARSPSLHAAVIAAGGRAHSVVDDVCSATQQLVSPIKSVSSPATAKPQSALRSPIKQTAHVKAAKQLQFGEQGKAASVARSSNAASLADVAAGGGSSVDAAGATSSSSGGGAAAAAAAAPDLAAASLMVANMDSLSPCTPTPCRSFDDSSHQPSFDSTPAAAGQAHASLAALLQSHPDDPSHVGVVSLSQSSAAAAVPQEQPTAEMTAAENKALDGSGALHGGVAVAPSASDFPAVSAAWSRARKLAGEEALDVDVEEKRTPAAPVATVVGVPSDHKRRGKSFNKQPKSTAARSTEGGLLVDAAAAAATTTSAALRPMLSVAASKPIPISLLSESQAEESQAEFSVDPFRRARAKKEAQAADAKSRRIRAEPPVALIVAKAEVDLESQDDLSPRSSPTQSPPKPAAAVAARPIIPLAEAPVILPIPVATPEPAASKATSPAHVSPQPKPTAGAAVTVVPAVAASSRSAKSPSPSNTGASASNNVSPVGGAAASTSRAVSPFPSMPASPRTPHHYGSSRKLIIHTLVKRPSPDGKRESPRLSPSAAAVAARQTENSASPTGYPPGMSDKKLTSSADGTAATRAKPTSLSAILEESSSNASAFTLGPSRVDSMRKTSAEPSVTAPVPAPAPAPAVAPAAKPVAASDDQVAPMEIDGADATPTSVASLPSSTLHVPPAAAAAAAASHPDVALDVEMSSAVASSASVARASASLMPSAPSDAAPPPPASPPSASAPLRAISTRKRGRGTISSSAESPSGSPVEDAESTSQGSSSSSSSGGGGGKRAKRSPIHVTAVFKSSSNRAASPAHSTPSAVASAAAASSSTAAAAIPAAALPTAPSSKQLRSSLMKGTLFLITGVSKHHSNDAAKQTRLIQQCGGRCVESLDELPPPNDATLRSPQIIVLASAPKRTMKFMFSLARGLPPLQPGWLESCVAATEVVVPSDAQLVPLKEEDGHVSKYPSAWLQSLRERRFLHPLPMHKRILHGLRIAVCAPTATVAEVAVVCREAGATVWSCDADKEEWKAWSSTEAEGATAAERADGGAASAAAASTARSSSRRAASKDAAGSSVVTGAPAVRLSRVDMVLVDKAESVTAWIKRSLSEAGGAAGSAAAAATSRGKSKTKSLPPIVSVRFLIQCLMQQKRLSDKEREEFIL